MRKESIRLVFVAGLAGALGGYLAGRIPQPATAGEPPKPKPKVSYSTGRVVRTSRLEIVDENGLVCIFAEARKGCPMLGLAGKKKGSGVMLSVNAKSMPSVNILDSGKLRMRLGLGTEGQSYILLADKGGEAKDARVALYCSKDGVGSLELADKKFVRAKLQVETKGGTFLRLYDPKGVPRAVMGVLPTGKPAVMLQTAEGDTWSAP